MTFTDGFDAVLATAARFDRLMSSLSVALFETMLPKKFIHKTGHDCDIRRTEDHAPYRGLSMALKAKADQPYGSGEQIYRDRYYRV